VTPPQLLTMPAVQLRLVAFGGAGLVILTHSPASLGMLLTGVPLGAWANVWPGVADEQVFSRCAGCAEPQALPVAVQLRRVVEGLSASA